MSATDEAPDRIEREILIHAPIERVWNLVSEPGWFIGDGDPAHRTVSRDGDFAVVNFPPYGTFPVRNVAVAAPHYVASRAMDDPARPQAEAARTLVEFHLEEQGDGTLLQVVESGFVDAYPSAKRRAAAVAENIQAWEMQLGVAKRDAERTAS
jgi:uncharacterized protein YndB with AHSA1/START domain